MTVVEHSRALALPLSGASERYWRASILASLLRATPFHAALCVLFYMVAQVALLAAVLLPWKLLMILSTDTHPRLMPVFLHGYPAGDLVLLLSAGGLGAFLLYALCEGAISAVCTHGARSILARHQKTGLFGSHRQQAASLYRRVLRSVGATVSCIFIGLWLVFFYPLLLLALATYLCAGLLVVRWWKSTSPKVWMAVHSPELRANGWWSFGFLYAVGWVVADYSRGGLPETTVIFISLLLVRQALVLSAQIYRTYGLLEQQRSKLGALFLAHVPWQPASRQDYAFHALLNPDRLRGWADDAIAKQFGPFDGEVAFQCRLGDSGKIISVTASGQIGGQRQAALLKLYHTSREELAHHEKEILRVAGKDWPAPALLADHLVGGHTCLVFDWGVKAHWMTAEERAAQLPSIRERLLACELPEELVSRYDRSQPHLAERLNAIELELLETLVPKNASAAFNELRTNWSALQRMLQGMPRQVVIPRLYQHRIGNLDSRAVICNWSRWRWEPVGAGWPRRTTYEQLRQALETAAATRAVLRLVAPGQAYLAAVFYEFEHLIRQKDFVSAVKLLPTLSDAIRHGLIDADARVMGGYLGR